MVALAARSPPRSGSQLEIAPFLGMVHIDLISAVTLHWSLVLTVSFACFIYTVMNGPTCVADSYPLPDWERPG
jgi:hypothetical protein